jgi:hypothetical protein
VIADLTHWWHWGPQDAWGLTGTELMWWLEQTRRIVAAQQQSRE